VLLCAVEAVEDRDCPQSRRRFWKRPENRPWTDVHGARDGHRGPDRPRADCGGPGSARTVVP